MEKGRVEIEGHNSDIREIRNDLKWIKGILATLAFFVFILMQIAANTQ